MRRERKEILREINQIGKEEDHEYVMGCGFGRDEIGKFFEPMIEELEWKLAATYGKNPKEYEDMVYRGGEIALKKLYDAGCIPFL